MGDRGKQGTEVCSLMNTPPSPVHAGRRRAASPFRPTAPSGRILGSRLRCSVLPSRRPGSLLRRRSEPYLRHPFRKNVTQKHQQLTERDDVACKVTRHAAELPRCHPPQAEEAAVSAA